jgi:type I restriction enzyme S subunit
MTWQEVSLGEICNPKQHKIISKSDLLDQGFVVYGANGPIGYYSEFTHDRTTIAVTCRGATCGTINIVPPKSYITGNAMALDDLDEDKVALSFLRYALEHKGFDSVINGAAQPQITRAPLLKYTIPLPPLDEQKRIAAMLDKADELRRLRQRSINRLNSLGQAIFYEMFGDGSSLESVSLKLLGKVSTGSTPPTSDADSFGGSVPFVTPGDLGSGEVVKRTLTETGAEKSRLVCAGAAFVCCIGATIGKMGQAIERSAFNQQINAIEWGDRIDSTFGFYALQQIRDVVIRKGKGASTTLPILKKSEFEKLAIIVPAMKEQTEFAQFIDCIREALANASEHHEKLQVLFESLRHRAFSGRL